MMRSTVTIFLFFVFFQFTYGQDAYHTNLQNFLQTNYGLPAGNWGFNNTENANLQSDFSYGSLTASDLDANGQDFSRKVSMNITQVDGPQWNSGYGLSNLNTVMDGDRCLLVIWLRSDANGGKASVLLQQSTTYATEFSLDNLLGDEWRQYLIPFEATDTYAPGELQLVVHLNWQDQMVELGGVALLDYGTSVALEDLPRQINNDLYPGYEPDAPWRSAAADRIEELRKANLDIQVFDEQGSPLEGAAVEVRMLEHQFGFGTAVAAHLFAGNSQQNDTYEQHILDLDGQGHGFNCAVLENATKWRAWEEGWFGLSQNDRANTVQWLVDQGIKVRGHTLVWPSWNNLPDDMEDNQNNPNYLKMRVLDHIEGILNYPGIAGNISDWDVLNEISVLNDLANAMAGAPEYATGREIYVDIFNELYAHEPDAVAYINDYTTFGSGSSQAAYDDLKQYVQEIVDAGVAVDGIGFQAHISAQPTGIEEVYNILQDFYATFDTRAKITEFDMSPLIDDELAATYLRDFYTIMFSHESVDAILMWGFWDGAHWFDNAPMFYQDWTLKPAGQAFLDLVFDEWWTEENGNTNAAGAYSLRGFKGTYEVTVDCGDYQIRDTLVLNGNTNFTMTCSPISDVDQLVEESLVKIFPNPVKNRVQVNWRGEEMAILRLFDHQGREVMAPVTARGAATLEVDLPEGVYQLQILLENGPVTSRLVIAK